MLYKKWWFVMGMIIAIFAIAALAGCTRHDASKQFESESQPMTESEMASSDPLNSVLGWNDLLYRLVAVTTASEAGAMLGQEGYHGAVASSFTIYQDVNEPKAVIFKSMDGTYYRAEPTDHVK